MSEKEARQLWAVSDCVCFDVDSTVCQDEGLDELADFCGVGDKVKRWTKKGMVGTIGFRESLSTRLQMVRPSKKSLEEFISIHPVRLTPGIRELVACLHSRGTDVYLVSGGFREIIGPAADQLSIPADRVFANSILFDDTGDYNTFDFNQPTSQTGGKGLVIQRIKTEGQYNTLTMIGDGYTDYEAFPPADVFIGFGGNVMRQKVKDLSPWYVTSFTELINALL
ncbi:Phosphoserine phosphatase-like [Oopsacas minuta]|uniref:Phosphoserine phosphatase n=1 Tax=Oopsacas minuta TaxID=111878 RepID=A0AAV7KDF3_9METZ|nr:Phosphoserine phosphatase-like [Oopsacas minuta]